MIEDIKDEHGLTKDNGVFMIEHVSVGISGGKELYFILTLGSPEWNTNLILEQKLVIELLDVLDADSALDDVCAFLCGQYVHVTTKEDMFLMPIETIGDVFEQRRVRFREESK